MQQDVTDLAHQRTLLAKERTFTAWSRTGLSAVAVGVAVARLLPLSDETWLTKALGAVLVITGLAIFIVGYASYRKALFKLADKGVRGTPAWAIALISLAFCCAGLLSLWLIYLA